MEEWKQIGQSNYEISTFGNVRNITRGNLLKPKPVQKKKDYVCYEVYIADEKGGKQKHHKIHQLVAKAFIPNPNNYTEIDHIDRNPANNRVENLRWSNRSQQCFNSRTRCDNKLGEKNIHFVEGRASPYKVCGVNIQTRFFKTLDDAISYRNILLKEGQ